MAFKDRRDRYFRFDKNYDPLLALNVDEYLIKHHPHLSAAQRKSVWIICQNNQLFDWSAVEAQVDQCVKTLTNDDNSSGDVSSAEVSDSVPLKPKPKRKRNAS